MEILLSNWHPFLFIAIKKPPITKINQRITFVNRKVSSRENLNFTLNFILFWHSDRCHETKKPVSRIKKLISITFFATRYQVVQILIDLVNFYGSLKSLWLRCPRVLIFKTKTQSPGQQNWIYSLNFEGHWRIYLWKGFMPNYGIIWSFLRLLSHIDDFQVNLG